MDSGDLLWKSTSIPSRELDQRKLKASLLLEGMKALRLDALTPGEGDFVFGLEFLVEGAKQHGLPYVSANLRRADDSELFPAFRVVERAGLRIGITGVTAPAYIGQGLKSLPVEESVRDAVTRLGKEDVDLVVLLSHQGLEADKQLARVVEGVDVVFAAHDRRLHVQPEVVRDTAIFQAGSRGKYLGQVELRLAEGRSGWADPAGRTKAQRRKQSLERQLKRYRGQLEDHEDPRIRARAESSIARVERQLETIVVPPADDGSRNQVNGLQVPMGKDIGDEPEMKKLVDATLDQLGDTIDEHAGHGHGGDHAGHGHGADHAGHGHGADHAHGGARSGTPAKQGPYVGAGVCMGCHPSQYSDWSSTSHAHAWRTLVREKRHFDQDCWSCHATGANKPGGPAHPKEVGSMGNVQCEACHGPGRKHISAPSKFHMQKSPSEKLCLSCHTMEQTEGRFVFDEYLPKVDHKP